MKSERQKALDGEFFNAVDPELQQIILRTKRLLRKLNDCDYADHESKHRIFEQLFGSIGEQIHIDVDFHCEYGVNIHMGNWVVINMNCTFVDNNRIDIGNHVLIASDVKIYTAAHPVTAKKRMIPGGGWNIYAQPVKIEDGVWIGGGAIILPGVTIGRNAVIGAGAVVTKDVPANAVAIGSPAKVLRYQEE